MFTNWQNMSAVRAFGRAGEAEIGRTRSSTLASIALTIALVACSIAGGCSGRLAKRSTDQLIAAEATRPSDSHLLRWVPSRFKVVGDSWTTVGTVQVPNHISFDLVDVLNVDAASPIQQCSLEWVLVQPDVYSLDSIPLRSTRPFYICRTELPNSVDMLRRNVDGKDGRTIDWFAEDQFARHDAHQLVPAGNRPLFEKLRERLRPYWLRPDAPVLVIKPEYALDICEWLTSRAEVDVRLPTIAEWGVAASGGSSARYWWGDGFTTNKVVWAGCRDLVDIAHEVADVEYGDANPFGLKNVIGNVAEMALCSDVEREALVERVVDETRDLPDIWSLSNGFESFTSIGFRPVPPRPAFVALGGGADAIDHPTTSGNCESLAGAAFDQALSNVDEIIRTSKRWKYPYTLGIPRLIGIRPVIEVPMHLVLPPRR